MENQHYSGFPLYNNAGNNYYKKVTLEECQKLCKMTHGCMFFNFDKDTCWLKWGLGYKITGGKFGLGPKNCPG